MSPRGTRHPAPTVDGEEVLVFSVRELNQHTAQVLDDIEKRGRPAYITRHGRFVGIYTPLEPGKIESRVLAEMAREIEQQDST